MTRPNGVNTNYTYDSLSRLLSVLHQAGVSTIDGATYTLDAAGNRTSKADLQAGVTSNYAYDAIYELTQVTQAANTTENYTYDPVRNRLSSLAAVTSSYNSSNELTSNTNATYTYDANGNTTSKTDSTGTTSYTWDFENRLTSVTLPATGGTVSFKYDPSGRRIFKSLGSGTDVYVYDGNAISETMDGGGNVQARYVQGQAIDEPLASQQSGAASYYDVDGLGSVTSMSSAAGSLAQTYAFDSFGKQTGSSGSLINSFQYTGREFDTETNLYFYRARYYDQSVGRFINEDPTHFAAGPNFYQYALNNPVALNDPTGTNPGAIALPWWLGGFGEAALPAWLGPGAAVGGVAIGSWYTGRGIGHIPIGNGQDVDDAVTDGFLWLMLFAERTIPKPAKPSCGCACTCRADANAGASGNIKPGLPLFAFGTAVASDCAQASKDAKRIATRNLGMIPRHMDCRCAGK